MGRDVDKSPTRGNATLTPDLDLAKTAMNRGHVLAGQTDPRSLEAAIAEYSKAIQILDTLLPLPPVSNSLGAALMNRGQLLHRIHGTSNSHLTIEGYLRAESVLRTCLDDSSEWPRRNLVGTLINHANLLLDLHQPEKAKAKTEEAIATLAFKEETDPTDCELAVLAVRTFCDATGQILPKLEPVEQESLAVQADEQVRKGLHYILNLRPYLTVEPFALASVRLFHFGCHLNAIHQPAELETFIRSHIQTLHDDEVRNQYIGTANEAIHSALNQIGKRFLSPSIEDPEQDRLAATSQRLGKLHTELNNL